MVCFCDDIIFEIKCLMYYEKHFKNVRRIVANGVKDSGNLCVWFEWVFFFFLTMLVFFPPIYFLECSKRSSEHYSWGGI